MPLPSARWSPVPLLLRHAPGHTRGTDSRHQAALQGHGRTRRGGNLSSGGHLRSRRDTGGHATNTVRDREAPGSNPGPPTKIVFKIAVFARSVSATCHREVTADGRVTSFSNPTGPATRLVQKSRVWLDAA